MREKNSQGNLSLFEKDGGQTAEMSGAAPETAEALSLPEENAPEAPDGEAVGAPGGEEEEKACVEDGDESGQPCGDEQPHEHDHSHSHDHGHKHGGDCACGHEHRSGCGCEHTDPKSPEGKKKIICLAVGAALLAAGLICGEGNALCPALCIACWLVCGLDVLREVAGNLAHGRFFDENFLMTVATIGAFAIGEYHEGAAVMLLFGVGELLESAAVSRSERSISALFDLRPETANRVRGMEVSLCHPAELSIGDTILVRPGERVPVDGVVLEGESELDLSALTGESMPLRAGPGDTALSGAVNRAGALMLRVTADYENSTLSRVLKLTREAAEQKAPAERFITSFARIYTPVVCLIALLIAVIPPIFWGNLSEWLHRALVFLVISCPCALVISAPLTNFAAIGGASSQGILIKGGAVLDRLDRLHTVAFDKTGTLTEGAFRVTEIRPAAGYTEKELLQIAAGAEAASNHPIARSIRLAAGLDDNIRPRGDYRELPGLGIRWEPKPGGPVVLAGNAALLARNDVRFPSAEGGGTVLYVASGKTYLGCILITDPLREYTPVALRALKEEGVERVVLLTGDRLPAAAAVAASVELDEVHAGLMPAEKMKKLEELHETLPEGACLAFVGDGVNDAPAIARSDVGMAMGGIGSDAAVETADVVIMTDDLRKVSEAMRFARKANRLVRQNVVFSLAVKAIVMVLGVLGRAPMWLAVFADVGVTLIAIANSLRAMKPEK